MRRLSWTALWWVLGANAAWATEPLQFGAVTAPAKLSDGQSSVFGFVGAPELGAGFRQGISGIELQATATFNYLLLAPAVEGTVKLRAFERGPLEVATGLGLGAVYNSGSRYYDGDNFHHFGFRPRLSGIATYQLSDTAAGIAALDVPVLFSIAPAGGWQVTPLLGGGAELYLGNGINALALAQLGVDALKEPLGVTQWRLGWQVKLGLGWRLF